MNNQVFFIGDTHFGQRSVLTFRDNYGDLLRDFPSIEEHDEYIIQQWNSVVRTCDKVYHLGDLIFDKSKLEILGRLNGHKRLIKGNHDLLKSSLYTAYFEEVYGCRILENIIFSHIPVHTDSLGDKFLGNVHGHLHANRIKDDRYLCVSCEQLEYVPIEFDLIREYYKDLRR